MEAPTTRSLFLDVLPAELRLRVYDYLLVADQPLKGLVARRDTKYNLDTRILRTNKQIHAEARNAFFSKNTFHISSLPPLPSSPLQGSGAFEPPLQAKDLPFIRHLIIDPLYYPTTLQTASGPGGWKPVCPAAERYVMNLTHLLTFVQRTLLSLSFCADTRPYATFGDEVFGPLAEGDDAGSALDVKKVLTVFHVMEANVRFGKAVEELECVRSVGVKFFFPESEFEFDVERGELCRRGLLFLASQIIFARSEIKIKAMLEGLWDEEEEEEDEGEDEGADVARRESFGVVQQARRVVEAMR